MDEVVEACFQVLGEEGVATTAADPELIAAVSHPPHNEAHIRKHTAQSRAAQVLSIVCMEAKYAPRIRGVLQKVRADAASETRAWCCFMLTRCLGRLGDAGSIDLLIDMLENGPTEASLGKNPPPTHSRTFSVNLADGRYYCHKCHSRGNPLGLWAAVHQLSLYDAALDLCRVPGREVPWIRRW